MKSNIVHAPAARNNGLKNVNGFVWQAHQQPEMASHFYFLVLLRLYFWFSSQM